MSAQGVGIDLVDVARFEKFNSDKENQFIKKVFSDYEVEYCFKYKNPSTHLAGIFALKEAVSKALGTDEFPFIKIEIKHKKDGSPEVYFKRDKLSLKVSIAHTDTMAIAIAVV